MDKAAHVVVDRVTVLSHSLAALVCAYGLQAVVYGVVIWWLMLIILQARG
jgi:hypothetical protein